MNESSTTWVASQKTCINWTSSVAIVHKIYLNN